MVALLAAWGLMTTLNGRTPIPRDIHLYRGYADAVLDGVFPYRGFLFEYPPVAIAPMLAAGLVRTDIGTFSWAFEGVMLASMLVVQRWASELGGRRSEAAAWALAGMPLLIGPLARERLDLFPTALAVAGLALACGAERDRGDARSQGRVLAGMGLLGLGAAAKLFPAIAAAAVIAWLAGEGDRRLAVRATAVFAAVVVVLCMPVALLAPDGFRKSVAFQSGRPVQVESTGALILRLAGGSDVTGTPNNPSKYRSHGLEGGHAGLVTGVLSGIQAAALIGMGAWCFQAARRGAPAGELAVAVLFGLLALLCLGKVLSPQFLIWVVPLVPVAWMTGRRMVAALVVGAAALTQWEYPRHYADVVAGSGVGMAIVAVRNLLLVAALVLLVVGVARRKGSERRGAALTRTGHAGEGSDP